MNNTMNDFLSQIKAEGKIGLVKPSVNLCQSYLKKASDCIKAAKLTNNALLYENSVAESYYAMYNSMQACLFFCGIKCENHTASIMLISIIFNNEELMKKLAKAKKERIDKQYYITGEENADITKQIADEMIKTAELINNELRVLIGSLDEASINKAREEVKKI